MRLRATQALATLTAISLILNLFLLSELRDAYVRAKIDTARPLHLDRFAAANRDIGSLGPGPRVVLFGDSRIAQWTPEPELTGLGAVVVKRGIGGETTEQMRWRLQPDALDLQPRITVIQGGINDLVAASLAKPPLRDSIVERCIENLTFFAQRLAAAGSHVLLLSIFPPAEPPVYRLPVWDDSIWTLVETVNERLGAANYPPNVEFLRTSAILMDADGAWHDGATRDTLHLNPAGYALLNAALRPRLSEWLD